jgi:hypothetical protein
MAEVVERFLTAMTAHDWDAMAACLTDGPFTRVGPYLDTYASKPDYLAYISTMLPTLPGYSMEISRISPVGDVVYAELAETVAHPDGKPLRTPECLVFELDERGLIARVEVFIQNAG